VLAVRCDSVLDMASPPRTVKRVPGLSDKAIKRLVGQFARPQGREETIEGVLGCCALRSLTGAQCKSVLARWCSCARLRRTRPHRDPGILGAAPLGRQRTSDLVTVWLGSPSLGRRGSAAHEPKGSTPRPP
jgi:hypothetical protein